MFQSGSLLLVAGTKQQLTVDYRVGAVKNSRLVKLQLESYADNSRSCWQGHPRRTVFERSAGQR